MRVAMQMVLVILLFLVALGLLGRSMGGIELAVWAVLLGASLYALARSRSSAPAGRR